MVASVRSVGAVATSGGSDPCVANLPTYQADDILVAYVACEPNPELVPTLTGFTLKTSRFTAAVASGVYVFWKRASASESAPTASGDTNGFHGTLVQIISIQGCPTSGDPFDVTATAQGTPATSPATLPGVTTTESDCFVLPAVASWGGGTPNGTNGFSGWTTGYTEAIDTLWAGGGGHGIALGVAGGVAASAGWTSDFNVTAAYGSYQTYVTLALKGVVVVPPTTVTVEGAMTASALAVIPDAVGAPPITTVTLVGAMTVSALARTPTFVESGLPTTITAVKMAATALASPPSLLIRVAALKMAATALVVAPTVDTTATIPPVTDSFNRAPGAIGTSDSGHPWIVQTGTWVIGTGTTANRALCTSGTGTQATVAIDSGFTSCSLQVDAIFPAVPGIDSGVIFAGTNSTNHLLLMTQDGTAVGNRLQLWKVDAGSYTSLWGPTTVPSFANSTTQVRIVWNATTGVIEVWVGGALRGTITLTSGDRTKYATATRQGLRENGVTTFFDNYSVTGLAGPAVPVSIQATVATALTLAPVPSVDTHALPILVDAPVAAASLTFPIPVPGFPAMTIQGDASSGTASFPSPTAAGEEDFPLVRPMRATALMILPNGTEPTTAGVPTARATGLALVPAFMARPVLDSWQFHDDFTGDELSPLWATGYESVFLQPEGPGGPAPTQPLDQVPFIADGEMTLRTGTTIRSRDWLTFGEWALRIEMKPIPSNYDLVVAIAFQAAFPQDGDYCGYFPFTPGCPVRGMPWTNGYERQMDWYTYMIGGRRYVARGWGAYDPYFDDAGGFEWAYYNPDGHGTIIMTSPHVRNGQNIGKYDSADAQPGGGQHGGFMPYWPMEGPHDNRYAARPVRLVIQVTGPPGESVVITGINLIPPATKITIPTAQLTGDVDRIAEFTYPRPYAGVVGNRVIKPPTIRTTGRFLVPFTPTILSVDYPMRADPSLFLFPEWGGPARPITTFVPDADAYANFVPPILVGEPVDVVIEATTASASARAIAPNTSGTVKVAYGITKMETRKMVVKIGLHKMEVGVGVRELVSA